MPLLTPEGTPFLGNPDPTYCMTAAEVGELLAAAISKITGDFVLMLTLYTAIALIVGIGLGALLMWMYCHPRNTEDK